MPLIVAGNRILICLLSFASLLPQALVPSAAAQFATTGPVLSIAAVAPPSTLITVQGAGFTPGGLVSIAVQDPWGEHSSETRWTIASEPTLDMLGHDDPALGFRAGGAIIDVIELFPATVYRPNGFTDPARGDLAQTGVACIHDLMIRAYDQRTDTWSNVVDVAGTC